MRFALLALAATLAVAGLWEYGAFATPRKQLMRVLGFGRPTGRSLLAGLSISTAVLAFYPAYVLIPFACLWERGGRPSGRRQCSTLRSTPSNRSRFRPVTTL